MERCVYLVEEEERFLCEEEEERKRKRRRKGCTVEREKGSFKIERKKN